MNQHPINPETLRKRNKKNNETPEQRQERLARERERKRQKRANETAKPREARLADMRERRREKTSTENAEERESRLRRDNERRRDSRAKNRNETEPRPQETNQTDYDNSATTISTDEHLLLQDFRKKMNDIKYEECPVCKERIPGMTLVTGMCRRCYMEKKKPKKFSEENNMDPGDVPEELKGLTDIEEMLIAQVFTVMSIYRLRGGQTGYKGNVINFPQNIQEFTTRLPWHPLSLEILLVQRQSENDPTGFSDFHVHRDRVANALLWLKENNQYYK